MNNIEKYIIVDDDAFNNIICRILIERTLGLVDVKTFEVPEEALAFIQDEYVSSTMPAILFLDINMPTITGWEFIEQFGKFSEEIKKQISIYILSSSVDPRDKDKAEGNKYIKSFLSKPLTRETILSIAVA